MGVFYLYNESLFMRDLWRFWMIFFPEASATSCVLNYLGTWQKILEFENWQYMLLYERHKLHAIKAENLTMMRGDFDFVFFCACILWLNASSWKRSTAIIIILPSKTLCFASSVDVQTLCSVSSVDVQVSPPQDT